MKYLEDGTASMYTEVASVLREVGETARHQLVERTNCHFSLETKNNHTDGCHYNRFSDSHDPHPHPVPSLLSQAKECIRFAGREERVGVSE